LALSRSFAPGSEARAGDGVVPIPAEAKTGIVTVTYSGMGNFSYSGTTAFGFGSGGRPSR
jgi:hypothetical protein